MGSQHAMAAILALKPAQRTQLDVERLVAFLEEQPFFAGVNPTCLELLSACLGIHHAPHGQAVLHVGELTDRLYLLLSGSCSVVRHSRREGFQPLPPQQLLPGQTMCEASLVVSGRRSDVAVTADSAAVKPPAAGGEAGGAAGAGSGAEAGASDGGADGGIFGCADGGSAGGGDSSGGGAVLMVLTRAAWNNMCARAPVQPEYGEAREALLCCCVRSLAASDPGVRTLEQAEDLAALLRLLPGLSHTSAPVLRAMSEAAQLRQLPAGTILYEECTRSESEFVVLAGAVETHTRPRRQGAANRAALRSALRSAVAVARARSARGRPKSVSTGEGHAPKTIRQKIEEERRAREQIKQSLALQRESLRTPKASSRPVAAKAVEDQFKKWMLEFLTRKRSASDTANNAAATTAVGMGAATRGGGDSGVLAGRTGSIKAADAWRRAATKALNATPGDHNADGGERSALERKDTTLLEYERRKMEEAGGVRDVGNLLGGAAARKAYMRGLATKDGGMYAEDEPEEISGGKAGAAPALAPPKSSVHWGAQDMRAEEGIDVDDVDEEEADPWVRLTYLDRRYQVVRKAIRYIDAVEKVMGVAKQNSTDDGKSPPGGGGGAATRGSQEPAQTVTGGTGGDPDADPEAADLLLLNANDDVAAASSGAAGGAGAGGGSGPGSSLAGSGPGPDDEVDDACEEHLEQLYGPCGGRVEAGHVAGELPAALLDIKGGAKRGAGPQRARRAHSAITGPSGADVLVVALEALRRGHEVARDDLVSERLAVLTALEPLRGLSDEHQSQLALGCTVLGLDANHVIVRQGQAVDALYVVQEGEVRLLDDPDTAPSAAPPPPPQQSPAAAGGGGSAAAAAAAAASSESPFRTAGAAAAGAGKLTSLKVRRAAASLAALSLLGPGGSFGESVLGYPEDLAAEVAAAATESGEDTGGAELALPQSQYLATAMTSRPTKLLVMPRSLLLRYGYLRSSLPPFAQMRREALKGRRQQLRVNVQNRPAAAAAAAVAAATAPATGGGAAAVSSGNGSRGTDSGAGGLLGLLQLPSLSSPTAAAGSGNPFQTPRPPPVRPMEVLEQLGIKPVLRRIYNAGAKPGMYASIGAVGGGGGGASSCANGRGGAPSSTAVTAPCSSASSIATSASSPEPLQCSFLLGGTYVPAGGGGNGADRQHRRELLAASALAANNTQSLSNAIARARAEDAPQSPSLPMVVNNVSSLAAPPYRASSDGVMAAASSGSGLSSGGFALPAASRMRPLRLSVSGVGTFTADSNSPSPVRRASVSGVALASGVVPIPSLASPQARSGRAQANATSAPNPHIVAVQLPRLPSNTGSGSVTPTAVSGGGGARARPNAPGESFLVRLEAAESSPRSFSPQPHTGASRSISSNNVGGGVGGGGGGAAVSLLGQRSSSHQSMARA